MVCISGLRRLKNNRCDSHGDGTFAIGAFPRWKISCNNFWFAGRSCTRISYTKQKLLYIRICKSVKIQNLAYYLFNLGVNFLCIFVYTCSKFSCMKVQACEFWLQQCLHVKIIKLQATKMLAARKLALWRCSLCLSRFSLKGKRANTMLRFEKIGEGAHTENLFFSFLNALFVRHLRWIFLKNCREFLINFRKNIWSKLTLEW